jgi:hypothetical protein
MSDPAFRTIKVRTESYDRIQRLLTLVAAKGWASLKSKRKSAASIADIVDEGLAVLEARQERKD